MGNDLLTATLETVYMVFFSSLFAVLLGGIIGVVLVVSDRRSVKENRILYSILSFIINILRSVPFLILIIYILPISRFLLKKSIGATAAILPLTVSAIPLVARIFESSLKEVDKGSIEAATSMGASKFQIVKVMISESAPSLIKGITIVVINLIGYSAMAGAIGAKGLGAMAINYGLYRFQYLNMTLPVVIIILLVQLVQVIGDYTSNKISKR